MSSQQNINTSLSSISYNEEIMELLSEGIYITDHEANTIYLNHSYELISGLSKSEMLGKNMKDLVEQGVISISGTLAALEKRDTFHSEQSFRTGKRAMITSTPIFDSLTGKNITMVVTTVREITELYIIRKELKIKEQMARKSRQQIDRLQKKLEGDEEVIVSDQRSIALLQMLDLVSPGQDPVLLIGEAGVGKETLAAYLQKHSTRADFPYLTVDFSLIPNSSLYGYFIGKNGDKEEAPEIGLLEYADRGTIFLTEIADIPEDITSLLLALLHRDRIKMGDGSLRKLNIRILAASRYTLPELNEQNRVHPKILDYFTTFPFEIPPLRNRRDDIIPLADKFLHQYNCRGMGKKSFHRDSLKKLLTYSWPENITQLKRLVEQSILRSQEDVILPDDIELPQEWYPADNLCEDSCKKIDLKEEAAKLEAHYMEAAFAHFKNTRDSAAILGMDSSTFVRKRQRYQKMGFMKTE
ncbi:MAG: sigma 54-interacting transcriptional regulator [Lachnospiraceae bacterium]